MGRVEGKIALVTGGARGLGEASSELLVREGASVVLTDVDTERGAETAERIGATFLEHDVASEESWKAVIASVVDRFGELDVLVNNAGLIRIGTVEDETAEEFRRVNAVMLDGVFYGMKHGIQVMKRSARRKSIINFSSINAVQGQSAFFAYTAAKGAVRSMTRAAAIHCQEQQYPIRVNTILPGALLTPMGDNLAGMVEKYVARTGNVPRLTPPKGPGTERFFPGGVQPEEAKIGPGIGEAADAGYLVVYLASDESKFVNGTEIRVDNAATIQPQ